MGGEIWTSLLLASVMFGSWELQWFLDMGCGEQLTGLVWIRRRNQKFHWSHSSPFLPFKAVSHFLMHCAPATWSER
ncbi:hypothetical protein BGW37DRAFT_482491 [Umbelopsis sp. PMI_123]|nr:hypothetical protein BGW37DRAFT_482491 [Umbelopsis sp. PMI_123]